MIRRFERRVHLHATPDTIFARLDDQTRLGEHMEKPSAMMGGGRMTFEFDAGRGRAVGSHIRMGGSAFGLSLFVDEVVTEREPPRLKSWRTVGKTRLVIIDTYTMGFRIDECADGARLMVWIEYRPSAGPAGLLAPMYARWCVNRMCEDAVRFFTDTETAPVVNRVAA